MRLKRDHRRVWQKVMGLDFGNSNILGLRQSEIDSLVAKVTKSLQAEGYTPLTEEVKHAVLAKYSNGNPEKAKELYKFFQDANEGLLLDVQDVQSVQEYMSNVDISAKTEKLYPGEFPPLVQMQGAEPLNSVSCYLDSLLFAMFARLESFEPMLYNVYDEGPVRKLSTALRIWVNLLRAGKLITSDITDQLRKVLAENGWAEADTDTQQDPSEAFVFITEKLQMPLLTLKMEIAHGGKEDKKDDHKYINERLLHVPVLGNPDDSPISLEACLEEYFSNSVVVRREIERRQSISSVAHGLSMKSQAAHVETVDVTDSARRGRSTTIDARPEFLSTNMFKPSAYEGSQVSFGSIVTEEGEESVPSIRRLRRSSTIRTAKNEISLPAWTFLQLLPFYTDSNPSTSSTEHFALKRPVLVICLKRYSWKSDGRTVRNNRKVLIPEVIELPHFVADDVDPRNEEKQTASHDILYGNFRLVLEAAICHRGRTINSGHYVSFVRDSIFSRREQLMRMKKNDAELYDASTISTLAGDTWLKHDDQAEVKVTKTTFRKAMATEMPYMLFYRMVHIDEPIKLQQVISNDSQLEKLHSNTDTFTTISTDTSSILTSDYNTSSSVDQMTDESVGSDGSDVDESRSTLRISAVDTGSSIPDVPISNVSILEEQPLGQTSKILVPIREPSGTMSPLERKYTDMSITRKSTRESQCTVDDDVLLDPAKIKSGSQNSASRSPSPASRSLGRLSRSSSRILRPHHSHGKKLHHRNSSADIESDHKHGKHSEHKHRVHDKDYSTDDERCVVS
ncbi:ubiquitin carboxyl-terminal hydrolase-domain-containing protein [Dipodascopsis uninucleata]